MSNQSQLPPGMERVGGSNAMAQLLRPTVFGRIGYALDRSLGVVFPGWAQKRLQARARMELSVRARQLATGGSPYRAGRSDRTTADWHPQWGSADLASIPYATIMCARARETVRNNPYAKSAVKAFRRNVVGQGIAAKAAIVGPDGKIDQETGRKIDRLWNRWARDAKACDTEKKNTLWEKTRLAVTELVTTGEHLIVLDYVPKKGQVGLVLQSYEPEQLYSYSILNPDNGNQIRGGIEVDAQGAPVAYYLLKKPWNDLYGQNQMTPDRIEAWRVLHICDRDRVRQTRGVTHFDASLGEVHELEDFRTGTLEAAKLESYIALIINKQTAASAGPTGLNPPAEGSAGAPAGGGDSTDGDDNRVSTYQRGMVFEGLLGESVTGLQPQRPGNQYVPFVDEHLQATAAGVNLGKSVVTRNYDTGTYSSKRQEMLEDRREYEAMQELICIQMLEPIRQAFIRYCFLERRIELPDFLGTDADGLPMEEHYHRTSWHCDGWQWIDPEKEANASKIRLENNLDTLKNILAEQGKSEDEVLEQRGMEVAKQRELRIDPLELQGKGPPQPESGDTKEPVGAPAPLNGEQITAALEVFNRLRDGSLSKAAAIQLLDAVGLDAAEAKATVDGMPIGKDDSGAAKDYLRKVVLALLLDPTTRAMVVNSAAVAGDKGLVGLTGIPLTPEKYVEPFVPVVAPPGSLVSGDVIKDPQGDVVGGAVEKTANADGAKPKAGEEQKTAGEDTGTTSKEAKP